MFRRQLPLDEGLLLIEKQDNRLESSIHMLFVRFDLTVIWIDSRLTVVDKVIARRWRPVYIPKIPAKYILELHRDRWEDYAIGNKVEFSRLT